LIDIIVTAQESNLTVCQPLRRSTAQFTLTPKELKAELALRGKWALDLRPF